MGRLTNTFIAGLVLAFLVHSRVVGMSEPDSLRDYVALRELIGAGALGKAMLVCEDLLDKYPRYLSLYETYSEVGQYQGKLQEARAFLESRFDGGIKPPYLYYGLGCVFMRMGDYRAAHEGFEQSLQFGLRECEVVKGLVYAYERMYGTNQAVAHYRMLCHRNPDRSDFWYGLSLSCWGSGDYLTALEAARRAASLEPAELHYRIAQAVLATSTGQTRNHERLIVSLIDSAKTHVDFESLGLLRASLVRTFTQDHRFGEAHAQTRLLLQEMSGIGNHRWLGWSYLRLSDLDFLEADFASAIVNASKAIASASKAGDVELELEGRSREFDCCMELGLFKRAIRNAQARLNGPDGQFPLKPIRALADNARAFMEVGEYEIGLEYGIRAVLSLDGSASNPGVAANIHSTLGQIYIGLGQIDEALSQFSQEEKILKGPLFSLRDVAVLRGNQGNCYLLQGQLTRAGKAFQQQFSLVKRTSYSRERAYALLNLGAFFIARGDPWKARDNYLLALSEGQRLNLPRVIAEATHSLALLSERVGSTQETIDWLSRAIEEWKRNNWLAKTGLLGTRGAKVISDDFERLLALLLRANRKEDAYSAAEAFNSHDGALLLEKNRANQLYDVHPLAKDGFPKLFRRRTPQKVGENDAGPGEGKAIPEIHGPIDELAELIAWEDDREDVNVTTVAPGTELSYPRTLAEIRKDDLADGKTAVLEYFIGAKYSFLFFVTSDTLEVFDLQTNRTAVNSLVKRIGKFMDGTPVESAAILGDRLSNSFQHLNYRPHLFVYLWERTSCPTEYPSDEQDIPYV